MYFHNILIPRDAYFLLPLESKQEATSEWNFTKCISEVKVNQLKVKYMHVRMGISTFKEIVGRLCFTPQQYQSKSALQVITLLYPDVQWFLGCGE